MLESGKATVAGCGKIVAATNPGQFQDKLQIRRYHDRKRQWNYFTGHPGRIMQFTISSAKTKRQRSDCLVVGVYSHRALSEQAQAVDRSARGKLAQIIRNSAFTGALAQTLTLYAMSGIASQRVVLVGLGSRTRMNPANFRKALDKAAQAVIASGAGSASLLLDEVSVSGHSSDWKLRQCLQQFASQSYRFKQMKSKAMQGTAPKLKRISYVADGDEATLKTALQQAHSIAAGTRLARDLGNCPANICTPTYLAEQARKLAARYPRLKSKTLEETQMKRLHMGALLSVSNGSREPAKLITLEYTGAGKKQKPIVLVGKGVTFDSGGISIKPSAAMDEMKFDMCGAASVLGTFEAVASMGLKINLVGIIPATENLPDGAASKPGDIVTSMAGHTIEILNTDAEGRLILCDALSFASRYNPQIVIDIATLTGACVIALGAQASGLFSNNQRLADDLLKAGVESGDRAWQMPLWPEYAEQLQSNAADFANVGGREGGSITAASFLSKFTTDYTWAHLDIAGTAWKSGRAKGATGRPVGLLCQYLLNHCGIE